MRHPAFFSTNMSCLKEQPTRSRLTTRRANTSRKSVRPLAGHVAVVAGATRGAGRGIARALGEAGATVYCTGRSVRGSLSPYGRPETIDETAEMIAAAGGTAIPVRVDHTVESEVEGLFGRIDREHGRLDILVNSIAGEEPMMAQCVVETNEAVSRAVAANERGIVDTCSLTNDKRSAV